MGLRGAEGDKPPPYGYGATKKGGDKFTALQFSESA
jgi:hypothetical protein